MHNIIPFVKKPQKLFKKEALSPQQIRSFNFGKYNNLTDGGIRNNISVHSQYSRSKQSENSKKKYAKDDSTAINFDARNEINKKLHQLNKR